MVRGQEMKKGKRRKAEREETIGERQTD